MEVHKYAKFCHSVRTTLLPVFALCDLAHLVSVSGGCYVVVITKILGTAHLDLLMPHTGGQSAAI